MSCRFIALCLVFSMSRIFACAPEHPEGYYDLTPAFLHYTNGPDANISLLLKEFIPIQAGKYAGDPYYQSYRRDIPGRTAYQQALQAFNGENGFDLTVPSVRLQGWGSNPCLSNNFIASLAFLESVRNNANEGQSSIEEWKELIILRHEIFQICSPASSSHADNIIQSLGSLQGDGHFLNHTSYLKAIIHFYTKKYNEAIALFSELSTCESPWIAEVSTYMIARTGFVAPQTNWNGYSQRNTQEMKESIAASEQHFLNYIKEYPDGKYTDSAKNFLRRVYLFSGQQEKLDEKFAGVHDQLLAGDYEDAKAAKKLIVELGRHYTAAERIDYSKPLLVAARLLRIDQQTLLKPLPGPITHLQNESKLIKTADLDAAQTQFIPYPELFDFVKLYLWYLQKDYKSIESYVYQPRISNIASQGALAIIAEAYETGGKYSKAAEIWSDLNRLEYSPFAQSRILVNLVKADKALAFLSKNTGNINPQVLNTCLNKILTDDQLLEIITDTRYKAQIRNEAGAAFLRRLVLQERYSEFLRIYRLLPDKGIYAQIETAVRLLDSNPKDTGGLMNIGYFLFYNQIHDVSKDYWSPAFLKQIRDYQDSRTTAVLKSPYDYFYEVIRAHDDGRKSDSEAKSLYYIIRCFKSHWKTGDCCWQNKKPDTYAPQEWFTRLHEKYPDSRWAKDTRYYY